MPTFTYDVTARVPLDNGADLPVYSVTLAMNGNAVRLLGLVQENPSFPNKWIAAASPDASTPPRFDPESGLVFLKRARGGFVSKNHAAMWLLGVSDARILPTEEP